MSLPPVFLLLKNLTNRRKSFFSSRESGKRQQISSSRQKSLSFTTDSKSGEVHSGYRFIAFDSMSQDQLDIYVTREEGGQPRRLTKDPAGDAVPSWSRNGRWIYFASRRSGDWQVWKMEVEGGQPPVQITRQGGFAPRESADGKFIYYAKGWGVPGIWKVPVAGGGETTVLEHSQAGLWGCWAVVETGIYFLNPEAAPWPAIEFFDFATEKSAPIVQLSGEPHRWNPGLAVSANETWLLYTQRKESESRDLMLVENFR